MVWADTDNPVCQIEINEFNQPPRVDRIIPQRAIDLALAAL